MAHCTIRLGVARPSPSATAGWPPCLRNVSAARTWQSRHTPALYKDALAQDLPSDVRKLIAQQYQGAIANHDLVRGLRDSFSAAA